jgi:hypothetical protein
VGCSGVATPSPFSPSPIPLVVYHLKEDVPPSIALPLLRASLFSTMQSNSQQALAEADERLPSTVVRSIVEQCLYGQLSLTNPTPTPVQIAGFWTISLNDPASTPTSIAAGAHFMHLQAHPAVSAKLRNFDMFVFDKMTIEPHYHLEDCNWLARLVREDWASRHADISWESIGTFPELVTGQWRTGVAVPVHGHFTIPLPVGLWDLSLGTMTALGHSITLMFATTHPLSATLRLRFNIYGHGYGRGLSDYPS